MIDCDADGVDRYFTLRYVTDDDTVGTLFFVDFQGKCSTLLTTTTLDRSRLVEGSINYASAHRRRNVSLWAVRAVPLLRVGRLAC